MVGPAIMAHMSTTLYHKDVFLPKRIRGLLPSGIKQLQYSEHALRASKEDRFGAISLPTSAEFVKCELIEVDTLYSKFVLRMGLDNNRDLVIVVIPTDDKKVWLVKTVWVNLKNDTHTTLNHSVYCKGKQ